MKIIGTQETSEIISTKSYFGTLLLGTLPIVGDILLIKWISNENVRKSKQNLCKAYLILKIVLLIPLINISLFIGLFLKFTNN